MRLLILRALVCVLLGLLANYVIALCLVIYARNVAKPQMVLPPPSWSGAWPGIPPPGWPPAATRLTVVFPGVVKHVVGANTPEPVSYVAETNLSGWPMSSFRGEWWREYRMSSSGPLTIRTVGMMHGECIIPVVPASPGVFVNTLAFALPLFVASCIPRFLRWRFGAQTTCRRCGYPLTGLASRPCPECGLAQQ